MAEPQLASVLNRLRHLAGAERAEEPSDAQLLGRFVESREETAFTALVERHGRLVWRVCRHVLRHEHDVEDAFQATFLVLARKASSIRKAESLSSWLHGVAHRVALRARSRAVRQSAALPEPPAPPPGPVTEAALLEVQAILDEEVRRLPGKLREPFVLCCLEGRSKTEAAQELGWKEGTVSGRLARARERLRDCLARRGVALTAALTAVALEEGATSGAVPATVLSASRSAISGLTACSSGAAELARGVLQAMLVEKLRGVLLVVFLVSVGAGWLALRMPAAQPGKPAPGESKRSEDDSSAAQKQGKKDGKPAEEKAVALPARKDAQGDPLPPGALARLGTLRFKHPDIVRSVVYSRDGKFVAAATGATIRLWNVADGKELACLREHTATVYPLALSPDGKTLASGGGDNRICLWDVRTPDQPIAKPRQLSGGEGTVAALSFSVDGKELFAGDNKSIRVLDVATGKEVRRIGEGKGWAFRIALSGDGKTLAAIHIVGGNPLANRASIRLWRVSDGSHIGQMEGVPKTVYSLALSPDGRTVAAGGDQGAKVWEAASGTTLVKLSGAAGYTPCVLFSRDSRTLLAGGAGSFREWRLPTGRPGRSFPVGGNYVYCARFSPDGKRLVAGGTRSVLLWDVATAKPLHPLVGPEGDVSAMFFTPNGKELLSSGHGRGIFRWEAATGRLAGQMDGPQAAAMAAVALSPDGRTLAVRGPDLAVVLLDARSGKQLVKFTRHLPPRTSAVTPMHVVFSSDGKTVFSSTSGIDQYIRQWRADTGEEVRSFSTGQDNSWGLAVSADGRTLYSAMMKGPIQVWDVASGKNVRQIGRSEFGPKRLCISPGGRRLAYVLSDGIYVHDAATGRELWKLPRPVGHFPTLAFSSDGRTLATAGPEDDRVRLWEMVTGKLRFEVVSAAGMGKSLAFSSDGRLFATGGSDTTALVWDYRLLPVAREPVAELTRKRFDELVGGLSNEDSKAAFWALCTLARAPKQSVALLGDRFVRGDAKGVAKLIDLLDDEDFDVRKKAMKDLIALGQAAAPLLKKAQASSPSIDVRLRAGVVLRQLAEAAGERRLHDLRALEVLEAANTPEARRLVEELSKGPGEEEFSQEAKATLGRMKKRRP